MSHGAAPGRGLPDAASAEPARLTVWVRGRVQRVAFRWWVRSRALELGLTGSATNLEDGRVLVVAEGAAGACHCLLRLLGEDPGPQGRPGRVTGVTGQWSAPRGGLRVHAALAPPISRDRTSPC